MSEIGLDGAARERHLGPSLMPDAVFPDEWLVASLDGIVPAGAWAEIRAAAGPAGTLWEAVVTRRLATDEQILAALSSRCRLPVAAVARVEPAVVAHVPEPLARRFGVLPLRVTEGSLEVATANPFDLDAEKALAFATGREVRLQLLPPRRIAERLDELYRPETAIEKVLEGMGGGAVVVQLAEAPPVDDLPATEAAASQRPVVRLVDLIISEGVLARASDIHLEPEEDGVAVRYRIDGVLRRTMTLPRGAGPPLLSRIKIMSALDIADRLRPQDGRARVAVNGQPIDLRVSTLPAAQGEKAVIRILDSRATLTSLEALGLVAREIEAIRALLRHREGLVLVTGPTGCGKTTTLYAMIRHIQTGGVNIVTVEDPVEYRLPGIVQVQVKERAGLTFAAALRSILRQDPNVILVGEIRDRETAQIAIQASLTGHLVLSTLHTNDASGAVTRLVDIGVEAYKIGAALRGVIAQRLMRRLCGACREIEPERLPEAERPAVPPGTTLHRAVGCPDCVTTGYRGRFPVVEVLAVTPGLDRAIAAGASADEIARSARRAGMKTLWDSGLAHVVAGESSVEELRRVVGPPAEWPPLAAAPSPSGPVAPPGGLLAPAFALLEEPPPPAPRGGAAPRVLLVEEDDGPRSALRELLEHAGCSVAEARDGVAALDQVDRIGPDVVVLDLEVGGLDGYGVLSRLRARRATAAIPVIVLTARGDEDSEVRVLELGADDVLAKPVRARALAARVEVALRRCRARR
ncbi:MAG: ATPase, T2SS/T4P/T4SS family [Gemmatimonadales bacterium]